MVEGYFSGICKGARVRSRNLFLNSRGSHYGWRKKFLDLTAAPLHIPEQYPSIITGHPHGIQEYAKEQELATEISSSIAAASKILWKQSFKDENLTKQLNSAKTPGNCQFLGIKRTNPEILANHSMNHRSNDKKMQEIQNVLAARYKTTLQLHHYFYEQHQN